MRKGKCENCAYDIVPRAQYPCNECVNQKNFYSKRNIGYGGKMPPADPQATSAMERFKNEFSQLQL